MLPRFTGWPVQAFVLATRALLPNNVFANAKATLSYERYIRVPKCMWLSSICNFSRLSFKLFRMMCKRYLFCFVAL
jgi:hypothetical protein